MKFHDIKIRTNTLGSEAISDMLLINGITSFSVSDPNDFAEIVEERSVPFDYYEDDLLPDDRSVAYVDVYIAYTEQGESQMQAVADGIAALKAENLPFGSLEYTVYETDDKDWENNWKQFFHPINIGNSFVIKPSWEDCTPDGRKVLEIDPESSFGTGRHETTRLCLELLEKTDCNDADVLDMGCGSGILGIGAYLLGAKSITAVDIDESAVLGDTLDLACVYLTDLKLHTASKLLAQIIRIRVSLLMCRRNGVHSDRHSLSPRALFFPYMRRGRHFREFFAYPRSRSYKRLS